MLPSTHGGSRSAARGFFVTGTDTGVGKTCIACGLLRAFAARGLRAIGMKPVAAGAAEENGRWINEDVAALEAAGNMSAPPQAVNPYCFAPPIAPHIAAAEAGTAIDLDVVAQAYGELARRADVVIVEGAGGFLVPLGRDDDMGSLAQRLALPVVMVVGLRLGCLNHALLTALAIRTRGLEMAGWVANHLEPDMPRADANVETLAARLGAPLLGRVPYAATPDAVARSLDTGTLLAGETSSPL